MKLRVGLVGIGEAWQNRHAPALRALADRFQVRAVCEQIAHRATQAAAEFGADAVDGYRVLTAREDVDVVLVLSPEWYGALPILAACEAGKDVYCAAGLHLEPEEARTLRDRVEQSGIAFMAEFPRRQAAATVRLKELIATRLGAPRLLFCHQRRPAAETNGQPGCQQPRRAPDAELVELVDWCRYVVARDPTSVTGLMHRRTPQASEEDYQMMSLDFSARDHPGSGPVAQISCGRYIPAGWEEALTYRPVAALQVACEKGIAFVDLPATVVWFDEAGRHQESLESERPIGEQLLTCFHRSVTSLVRKLCDLDDAYRALTIVQQARTSHHQGRRIALE